MLLSWPKGAIYSDALQNPAHCFIDAQLKTGVPKTDQFGIPMLMDGGFASVFQMQCGSNVFAVKCFTKSVSDREQRYYKLSQYLGQRRLKCLVEFVYLPQAIRIEGHEYPIVRMEWANAQPLDHYIINHLSTPSLFIDIAEAFRAVMIELAYYQIAHCDLQHGNVLVANTGRIRLVDYDGMYVPSLNGTPPEESGHHNYQHPEQYRYHFYCELGDAFSALVIYLSLKALAADTSLWQTFNNGDNLIFQAGDFSSPGQTPIWSELKSSPDHEVRRLTDVLEELCKKPIQNIDSFETLIQGSSAGVQAKNSVPSTTASGAGLNQAYSTQPLPPVNTYPGNPLGIASAPPSQKPIYQHPSAITPVALPGWSEADSGRLLQWRMITVVVITLIILTAFFIGGAPLLQQVASQNQRGHSVMPTESR